MSVSEEPVVQPLYGYLVRCQGALPMGGVCPHYVLLTAEEKTTCRVCGRVHSCWTDYCLSRSKVVGSPPVSPLPALPPVVAKAGGGDSF